MHDIAKQPKSQADPGTQTQRILLHSTRLFPRDRGAKAYSLTGISSRCDLAVMTDLEPPRIDLRRRVAGQPRHIFLSLRHPYAAVRYMAENLLPRLTEPFVLISGSKDITIPNQRDVRFRRFNDQEQAMIASILAHPLLLHWFAENLDTADHPKLSPLPIGVLPAGDGTLEPVKVPDPPPIMARPLRILCAHRIRKGPQWHNRREITATAQKHWSGFTTVPEGNISAAKFAEKLQSHAFVICASGGGLDPCPKLWETLLMGAIPIIERNALEQAYRQLPVVFVDNWRPQAITLDKLERWRQDLRDRFDEPAARADVLKRLGLDYWWQQIEARAVGQVAKAGDEHGH